MDLHRLAQRAATRAVIRSFSRVQTHPARLARLKSTGSNTSRKQEETPNGFNADEPIRYENQQEAWKESFLTPYMLKYPALRKTANTIYNGLGLYRKQNDAIRNSKYWYMRCAERDIMERDFLYKGMQALPELSPSLTLIRRMSNTANLPFLVPNNKYSRLASHSPIPRASQTAREILPPIPRRLFLPRHRRPPACSPWPTDE